MTTDDLIKFMGVVVTLIIAWLGYQQVKSKNAGDAVYATAQSVVLLSKRVRELEDEKAELSDRFDKDKIELNERLEAEITRLRGELDTARTVVAELRQTIQRGEAAMKDLQRQVADDKIVRDEVVNALTMEVKELKEAREAERRQWEQERAHYLEGIGLLLGQLVDAKIEPTWLPSGVERPKQKQKGGLIP